MLIFQGVIVVEKCCQVDSPWGAKYAWTSIATSILTLLPVKHQPGPVFPKKSLLDKNQTIGIWIEHIKKVLEEDQLRRILREMLEEHRSFRLNDFK